ncbi:MAG: hypothetical protein PHT80_03740 [Lentisphaeria bacterium]|nr:hypothetical protein [Lentisphaeria bacterium]
MDQSSLNNSTRITPWRLTRQLALFVLMAGNVLLPELHHARHSFAICDDTTIAMAVGQQFLTQPGCADQHQHNAQRCPLCQLFAQLFSATPPPPLTCPALPVDVAAPVFRIQQVHARKAQHSSQSRAPPVLPASC